MMPGHGSYVPQSGPSPFQLEVTPTSAPSDPSDPSSPSIFCLNGNSVQSKVLRKLDWLLPWLIVTLSSRYENVPFKGFFIQGRTSADLQSSKTMGGFLPQEDNNHVQLINCPGRISVRIIPVMISLAMILWLPRTDLHDRAVRLMSSTTRSGASRSYGCRLLVSPASPSFRNNFLTNKPILSLISNDLVDTIRATVVKEFDTFWVGLESNPARI